MRQPAILSKENAQLLQGSTTAGANKGLKFVCFQEGMQ
jgi:hypothetical protein